MISTQVVLDRVMGDNHRLGAHAKREKYERNEGVDDVEHRVSYKREVPLIEYVPRPQKEAWVEDVDE